MTKVARLARLARPARLLTRSLPLALVALAQVALAQDALSDITVFLCTIFQSLSGPFGIAAGLVVLAVGALLWALGARGALSRIGQAVIAITVLLSLPTLFFTLFPGATATC